MSKEAEKRLSNKVKDCHNTTTIFDTRKYVLLSDAIEAMQAYADEQEQENLATIAYLRKEIEFL